jgi:hypothetical protein
MTRYFWLGLLVTVFALLVSAPAAAQRGDIAMSVSPPRAASGIVIKVTASYLDTARAHEVRLVGNHVNQLLLTTTPTTTTYTFKTSVPSVGAGAYEIVLLEKPPFGIGEEIGREPLQVLPSLTTTVLTANAQAGKSLRIDVSGLSPGMFRVVYGNRVIHGPVAVRTPTRNTKFTLPADYPAGLPGTVTMKVENLIGTQAINRSTHTLQVAAPYSGPRLTISNLQTSVPNPRAGERFTVSGRLDTFDGMPRSAVDTSFTWIGNNGAVVPLQTRDYQIDNNGNFTFATQADERGYMSAGPMLGVGRITAGSRYQTEDGHDQMHLQDSGISDIYDLDDDADIRIVVRKIPAGGGAPVPLEGAIVIASASESIDTTYPAFDDPDNDSGFVNLSQVPTFSFNNQLRNNMQLSEFENQTLQIFNGCPASGLTKYSNASGIVDYQLVQPTGNDGNGIEADNPGSTGVGLDQGLSSYPCNFDEQGLPHDTCYRGGVTDYIDFTIQVRGMHLGFGHFNPATGAEDAVQLRISYNEDNGRINVHRGGSMQTYNTSATIFVDLPDAAAYTNRILIGDPWMDRVPRYFDERAGGLRIPHLGKFIDYTYATAEGVDVVFTNPGALNDRKLYFHHEPDADGSLTLAELFYYPSPTSTPVKLGNFTRINDIPNCAFVPGAAELYEFLPSDTFMLGLRYPGLISAPGIPHPQFLHLEIRVRNIAGRTGKRLMSLDFQMPPGAWNNYDTINVDDSDLFNVKVVSDGAALSSQGTSAPNPGYGVGARDNNKFVSTGLYQTVGPQGVSAGQNNLVADAEQFSRTPEAPLLNNFDANANAVIAIGTQSEKELFNQSFPVFYYAWGLPEVLAIELSVELGLRATYRFFGSLDLRGNDEKLTLTSENNFYVMVTPQAEIDVLFGLLFDAGASLPMIFQSTMPLVMEDGDIIENEPCFGFSMLFSAYFDPCNLCPWDTEIDFSEVLLAGNDGGGCSSNMQMSPLLPGSKSQQLAAAGKDLAKDLPTPGELRALVRHPGIAFDRTGNGHLFALNATKGLAATKLSGGEPGTSSVLSTAPNIRHPVLAYYAANRAVAAWVESAASTATLTSLDIAGKTSNQRIAWSQWNGKLWSAKQFLTSAGQGQGHLAIAACAAGESGCPAAGEATLVWQTNSSGNIRSPSMRLQFATYTPNATTGNFSSVSNMQSGVIGVQDITPSIDYAVGTSNPIVVWVRYLGTDLTDIADRTLAWRFLNEVTVANMAGTQRRVAQPSVESTGARGFRVAFTVSDAGRTFAGNHQALYTGSASCTFNPCLWSIRRQADEHGRSIYVDRPQLVRDGNGDSSVIARIQRFGDDGTGPVLRDDDPPGVALGSGDLIQLRQLDNGTRSRVTQITADGELHLQSNAAFNPGTNEIATVSVRATNPTLRALGAKYRELYPAAAKGLGKNVTVDAGLGLSSLPATPDPAVHVLSSATPNLSGGTPVSVQVVIANRGGGYDPVRDGNMNLELRFDASTGTGAPAMTIAVPAIDGGGEFSTTLNVPVPAAFRTDEPHTLFANLVALATDWQELDADNNVATLPFGAMPVPHTLVSEVKPGLPFAGFSWASDTDARVVGYRIYAEDDPGQTFAIGSSAVKGFLDLTSRFGQSRSYRVASYSARGIESALSEPIHVTPRDRLREVIDPVFGNGFETL